MKLRVVSLVGALGLATALFAAAPADAGHRDRDHRSRGHYSDHSRSVRSYGGGYHRSYRAYGPRSVYRPYRSYRPYRRYYGSPLTYDPYAYGYGYVPYVPYRPYCRPRLRVGVGIRW
jgi:hypothetical protein